jgi:hypothetical protein
VKLKLNLYLCFKAIRSILFYFVFVIDFHYTCDISCDYCFNIVAIVLQKRVGQMTINTHNDIFFANQKSQFEHKIKEKNCSTM